MIRASAFLRKINDLAPVLLVGGEGFEPPPYRPEKRARHSDSTTARRRMRRTCEFAAASAFAFVLTACGGGGDPGPTATPASTPPAAPPAAACVPVVPVRIVLAGDSTQVFTWQLLQVALEHEFGMSSVEVTDIARNGATTAHITRADLAGFNISVLNFGINDSAIVPIDQYKANLRALRPTLFETPNPTWSDIRPHAATQEYAQAMREVAHQLGAPVADVNSYLMHTHGIPAHLHGGVHPDSETYRLIVDQVLAPAVAPLVAALRCE